MLSVGVEKLGRENHPFIRLAIRLYDPLLTTILLRLRQLHHVRMVKLSDALFICRCAKTRRTKLSPVPEAQVEEKGNETSRTVVAHEGQGLV
jgi:hypothetical protein